MDTAVTSCIISKYLLEREFLIKKLFWIVSKKKTETFAEMLR